MDSTAASTVGARSTESNIDTPTARIEASKPLSSSNGVLKRHHSPPPAVIYKDCLRNHAASLGGYAVDGCGEFLPSPSATAADPTSLKCAACGCHRNFHRRVREAPPSPLPLPARVTEVPEFHSHHRHHPPPPSSGTPESPSPPPISSSYVPSAPHMLLALSTAANSSPAIDATPAAEAAARGSILNGRKRFRTRFSPAQKEKMYRFAESVGWKMQRRNEELMTRFCGEVGVDRGVFKVWMHNNKNTLRKRNVSDKYGNRRNSHRIIAEQDGGSSPNYDDHRVGGGGTAVATATEPSSSS